MAKTNNITKIDQQLRKYGLAIVDRYFVKKTDRSIRIRVNYISPITKTDFIPPVARY